MSASRKSSSREAEARAQRVFGVLGEPRGVVIDDRHAERAGKTGDLTTDIAETDDAQGLPAQFREARDLVAAPASAGDIGVLAHQPTGRREHQHQRVFGDRDRIGASIVGDGDPRAPRRVDVGSVIAGAQQLDQAQPGRLEKQRFVDGAVHEAHEIFGVADGNVEFRTPERRDGEVEARRGEPPRRFPGAGKTAGENDLRAHGSSPSPRSRGRHRANR